MNATISLIKSDMVTEAIKSGNTSKIAQLIADKKKALANAIENANFYKSIGNEEFAATEQQRANRLAKDIERLSK